MSNEVVELVRDEFNKPYIVLILRAYDSSHLPLFSFFFFSHTKMILVRMHILGRGKCNCNKSSGKKKIIPEPLRDEYKKLTHLSRGL